MTAISVTLFIFATTSFIFSAAAIDREHLGIAIVLLVLTTIFIAFGLLFLDFPEETVTSNHDSPYKLRDYQVEVTQDSVIWYDGERRVGAIVLGCDNTGVLILQDNQ